MNKIGEYFKVFFKSIFRFLSPAFTLGYSDKETQASNRITIFTNTVGYFGIVTGLTVFTQLDALGMPKGIKITFYILVSIVTVGLLLNYFHKYFWARWVILLTGYLTAINANLIFGKTFNGHYFFFSAIVFSVLAFSRQPLALRILAVLFAYTGLPLVDYLYYYDIFPITDLQSKNFPIGLLLSDTLVAPVFIVIIIWIEKTFADKYEIELERSLETIRREKQKTKTIFDHIDLGIVMINPCLTLDSEYSQKTEEIFESEEIAGKNLIAFLSARSNLNKETYDSTTDILSLSIGEDILNWELNSANLPQECVLDFSGRKKYIQLSWTPIVNSKVVEKVILAIKDITTEIETKRKLEYGRILENRGREILTSTIKVGAENTLLFIDQLRQYWTQVSENRTLLLHEDSMRILHTLKGEARLMELLECSKFLHQLEDLLSTANPTPSIPEVELTAFSETFSRYVQDLKGVSEKMFRTLNVGHTSWSLLNYMGKIKVKSEEQLRHENPTYQIAKFIVQDEVSEWPTDVVVDVQKILNLAVQNSVDHGYLISKNTNKSIEILVKATQENSRIQLQIEDWGSGINLDRLKKLYEERGLTVGENIYDILFLDKVSTATSVSQTSGRGVGLSAIQSLAQKAGGRVRIENAANHPGTCLTIIL